MPAITVRRIPLADTRSYAAPSGLSRVRMTPNGVTMLAAVNGHGAYDDYHGNGAKKHRRKAAKRTRKAARLRARARGKGVSAAKRAKLYKRAKRKTKRAKRSTKRASWHKQIKKLAHKAGMTRKQLIALIRERTGMTKSEAKAEVKDALAPSGSFSYASPAAAAYEGGEVKWAAPEFKSWGNSKSGTHTGGKQQKLSFNGRDTMSRNSLAGVKKYYRSISRHASKAEAKRALVKKFGSKLAQEALAGEGGNMARKTKKKGHRKARRRSRSTGYRSAARRKGRKAHRRVARRSRWTTRTRGRRRMRRNGSDEFEANGSDEYEENGSDEDDDFSPNKKRGGKKKAKAKRRITATSKGIFGKKMLKELGLIEDFGGANPMASILLDRLAERRLSGGITLDQYKALRKQIAKAAFPKQKGTGKHLIPVEVTDPFSGKTKLVKVPWKGKVRTAFGPFKRRTKGGALTYEWEKGEHIPEWALQGGYSRADLMAMYEDPEFAAESQSIYKRIQALRAQDAGRKSAEVDRKIRKLQERLAKITSEGDVYTPNARGRGRRKSSRKGKRRMSAKQRAAFKKMIAAGARKRRGKGRRKARRSSKRRSGKRRSSKRSYKKNGRRSYGRRKARKSGKRRSSRGRKLGRKSGRRKARRSGKRRSSRRSSRGRKTRSRGRRRMRRNGSETVLLSIAGATAGAVTHRYLKNFLLGQVGPSLSFAGSYAPLLVSALTAAAGAFALTKVADHFGGAVRDAYGAAIVGMFASFGLGAVVDLVPGIAGQLSGIPYLNTSGWGSRRPLSDYELRGLGQYELRGLGASPQQALAAYELRGLGATPQQALAGGYAQALAGNPNYAQAMAAYELRGLGGEGILPSQADAALDMADQGGEADSLTMQGGEYVNTQLRPGLPEFWADPLSDIGVPSDAGGGVPWKSIWNPDQSGIDPTGGIFDDPNTP